MAQAHMTPNGYMPRIVDAQVEEYLETFGAVEVAGTKWCGKTWTSLAHASSVAYVESNLDLARSDPAVLLLGERPRAIDEWQLVPAIWDCVRRGVDAERGVRGAWILTGSSTPRGKGANGECSDKAPIHSGAGRIGRVRMYPMSFFESGESTGAVSLRGLFEGAFEPCVVEGGTRAVVEASCRGGWPEVVSEDPSRAQRVVRSYLQALFEQSVPAQGLNGDTARRLALSLARNLGSAATYSTIKRDMYGEEDDPEAFVSDMTVASYVDLLKRLYLVDEVPGWVPATRSRKRVATRAKRYFADPSLAVALLGLSVDGLYADWQTFGLVFENLCLRDLLVYARALPDIGFEPVRYYRDDAGLEVDAIIELADGRWAAFEIKVSEDKVPAGIATLKALRRKVVDASSAARVRPPEFMAVVTGASEYAREAEEGIFVIPLRALTA